MFREGNLGFEEKDTVYLPAPRWSGTDQSQTRFYAKLITPNHRYADDVADNDRYEVGFEMVPRWEPFRLLLRTNGQGTRKQIDYHQMKEVSLYLTNLV